MRRSRKPRQAVTDHPTRTLLIEAAATLLKDKGVVAFHVDDVLEATELTRGALYHHFDNVDDLVESALLAIYAEGIAVNLAFVRDTLASATSYEDFRAGVLHANQMYVLNDNLRTVRTLRAHALATSAGATRMGPALAAHQQALTDEYIALITQAKDKGWVKSTVDPGALAIFVQAYSFGVIIDDVAERHVSPADWSHLIEDFFEQCVFTGGSRRSA